MSNAPLIQELHVYWPSIHFAYVLLIAKLDTLDHLEWSSYIYYTQLSNSYNKKYSRMIKVVIITNLEQKQNLHKMLKIQQIFPKFYRCLLYVVFHNLKPQNAGLVDVKKDLN